MSLRESIKSVLEQAAVYSPYSAMFSRQRQCRDLLRRKNADVVIDAGAFVGSYAKELRRWGFKGKIYSFEPVPASFRMLSEAMGADPNWKGHPFGLSDATTTAVMNTYSAGDFNSLLPLESRAGAAYEVETSKSTPVQIQLRRLDEVLPALLEANPGARVMLKMDTQGHDLSVFRGAAGVLDRIVCLQSELAAVTLYAGAPAMSESLSVYRESGFIPVGFHPVSKTVHGEQIVPEFDVFFERFQGFTS